MDVDDESDYIREHLSLCVVFGFVRVSVAYVGAYGHHGRKEVEGGI